MKSFGGGDEELAKVFQSMALKCSGRLRRAAGSFNNKSVKDH